MADLRLNDIRKFAIEQEASILMKSPSHERVAEVSKNGIIQWVRIEAEASQEWLINPVGIPFEEVLASAQEFVIQRPQGKILICTREKFTALLAPQPSVTTATSPGDED